MRPDVDFTPELLRATVDGRAFVSLQIPDALRDLTPNSFTAKACDPMNDQAPNEISEEQAMLRAILHGAVDAIITIDERGIVESINPATETLFGYPKNEVVGSNVKMLMPPPFRDEHDGYLAEYLATRIPKIIGIGREVVGKRKDGSTFPMHLAVSEVHVGERRLFTGIVRDISDLKEVERELARMNEELEARVQSRTQQLRETQSELVQKEKLATLGKVSGGIAHEIRNPLNAVKTSAFFLLHAKDPSPEKVAEHLERIDRQVTLVDNVVTALTDVARLPEPQAHPMSIALCIVSVLGEMSLPANIEIDLQIPEDLPNIVADENQIPIVFRNLFRNARDAMPTGGTLAISAESLDGNVRVVVEDTGTGIDPEILARIMEPLFSTKARGMGLGLAISQTILEKNRGSMEVRSAPGVGSRFVVVLESAGLG